MMYWYYALAGRIGSDAAWAATLNWQGDVATVERTITSLCVRSVVAAIDQPGQWRMLQALEEWARLAPPQARTTVTPVADDRVEVVSCDPGPGADTIALGDIRLFGGAPDELAVVGAMLRAGLPDTDGARACVVHSLRSGHAVPVTEPQSVDRSLTGRTADVESHHAQMLMESCRAL